MRRIFRLGEGSRHLEREVDDELQFHIEQRAERLIAQGMDAAAAHTAAQQQFGDVSSIRSEVLGIDRDAERHARRASLLDDLRSDVALAARSLRTRAGFSAVVVLTLALGIGANTSIFTLIDAVMLRRLPVSHPEELVAIGDPTRVGSLSEGTPRPDLLSYPLYRAVTDSSALLAGVLATGRAPVLDVSAPGERTPGAGADDHAEHPRARFVSGNYFRVLGVRVQVGRAFNADEDNADSPTPVAVIGDGYWERHFARRPSAVGSTLIVNGVPFTVIGVAPKGFFGEIVGRSNDIWLPIATQPLVMPHSPWLHDAGISFLLLIARRAPGVTTAQVEAQLTARVRHAIADFGAQRNNPTLIAKAKGDTVQVTDGSRGLSRVRVDFKRPLFVLMTAVALVLLIVCANLANLLLARAAAREREISVRMALGAWRMRLVRQLLTESLVLSILGGAAGLLVASWITALFLRLGSYGAGSLPLDAHLNGHVLAFSLGISALAALMFGLVPAFRATHLDLASSLKANARSLPGGALNAPGRFGLGKALVVSQVALSLVLLVGAGLLVRSMQKLLNTDLGLARDELLIADVDFAKGGYRGARLGAFTLELMDRLSHVPGVTGATVSENGIFSGTESESTIQAEGFTARTPNDTLSFYDHAGPNYARTIGAHLLEGRDILPSDGPAAPQVAIVNETFAHFYFPHESAIGKHFKTDSVTNVEIVGVIADVRDHVIRGDPVRRFYIPYHQGVDSVTSTRLVIRGANVSSLITPVRRAMLDADAKLPVVDIDPLSALVRDSVSEEHLLAQVAAVFGVLALLLAAVGLYGVMAYTISRRTGEFGLRLALGAEPTAVRSMVLRETLTLVAFGVVVGLVVAAGVTRLLAAQLYDVAPLDPLTITGALIVIGSSAVIAGIVPASRASRVDPLVALRQE